MDPQQVYNQARQAQKDGRLAEAERLYRRILHRTLQPEVLVNLGNVLAAQSRREGSPGELRQGAGGKARSVLRRCSTAPMCFWS